MGIACPQCSSNVDIDFGMAQCSQCQAVFYVNIDGSISRSEDMEQAPEEVSSQQEGSTHLDPDPVVENQIFENEHPAEVPSQTEEQNNDWGGNWDQQSNDVVSETASSTEWDQPEANPDGWGVASDPIDNPQEQGNDFSVSSNDQESFAVVEDNVSNQIIEEDFSSQENQLESVSSGEVESDWSADEFADGPSSAREMIEEVVEFGNSEVSGAREGIISYNLLIQGIDTSQERGLLRDVLEDRKLMLSVEELLAEVNEGRLLIRNLNPVKASVIVAGLHNSGLNVEWSQHALNE